MDESAPRRSGHWLKSDFRCWAAKRRAGARAHELRVPSAECRERFESFPTAPSPQRLVGMSCTASLAHDRTVATHTLPNIPMTLAFILVFQLLRLRCARLLIVGSLQTAVQCCTARTLALPPFLQLHSVTAIYDLSTMGGTGWTHCATLSSAHNASFVLHEHAFSTVDCTAGSARDRA